MASGRMLPTPANIRNVELKSNSGFNETPRDPENTINALGPELAVATTQVLDSLNEKERQIILDVLNRDEGVRQRDAARLLILRTELQNIRRKGALRTCGSLDRPNIESNQSCSRCRIELGKVINRGATCRCCRLRVCKGCREFFNYSTDWVCIFCHKQMELQAASGEWINEYARGHESRRDSITKEYLPASDIIKKSIRRSWTISSSQHDDRVHSQHDDENYPLDQPNAYYNQTMDYQNNEYYDRVTQHHSRRVVRQSTLPTNIPNPENYYQNNVNLMPPPVSPKQQLSPQYNTSPYNTDSEDLADCSNTDHKQIRYPIRRQSTLPCRPNEHHAQKYLSTSPIRNFSRSPEKHESDQRYPPFVRQSTFPSNMSEPYTNRPKILLPPSPNRLPYNKSPEGVMESDLPKRHGGIVRQSTLPLPNADQHIKLLPTSPPKRQSSPQYMKRSPEIVRQNTLPNPDGMNSLNIHQQAPKFLPISPRLKQNFLFPQPNLNPRQFLSHQNVPTVIDDTYSSTGSVGCPQQHREHISKMIKVRSHSNEEYSANRPPLPIEGRRMLPEIPRNHSPNRLVRQGHVMEDNRHNQQVDKRTFSEAKQNLPEYDDCNSYREHSFLEVDEEESYEGPQYKNVYSASDSKVRYDEEEKPKTKVGHNVRSAESFLNDTLPEYNHPDEGFRHSRKDRNRRRRSREIIESEIHASSNEDEPRRKPETMRSISEDIPPKSNSKPVTRRSLSHPERETQNSKRIDHTKIPSPKPLADILEKSKRDKPSKIPSPRRKNFKTVDNSDIPAARTHVQRRDSKSSIHRGDNKEDDFEHKDEDPTQEDASTATNEEIKDDDLASKSESEHKTTLGEAEIQSAVEAAAVIFKKVVLQRRQAAKKNAEEGYRKRNLSFIQDDISDYETHGTSKMFCQDSDDYKLVFISSDSSSKEDEFGETSSTTSSIQTTQSIEECDWDWDWDYFEPGVSRMIFKEYSKSPFDSPILARKHNSPLVSPIFYRRKLSSSPLLYRHKLCRESDTGTDEELIHQTESSSPISSDSYIMPSVFLKKSVSKFGGKKQPIDDTIDRKACDCGTVPQYVPIPVPIPVPIADFQNWKPADLMLNQSNNENSHLRAIQQKQAADIFHLWNSAAPSILMQHHHQQQLQQKQRNNEDIHNVQQTHNQVFTEQILTEMFCKSTTHAEDEDKQQRNEHTSCAGQAVSRPSAEYFSIKSTVCNEPTSSLCNINEAITSSTERSIKDCAAPIDHSSITGKTIDKDTLLSCVDKTFVSGDNNNDDDDGTSVLNVTQVSSSSENAKQKPIFECNVVPVVDITGGCYSETDVNKLNETVRVDIVDLSIDDSVQLDLNNKSMEIASSAISDETSKGYLRSDYIISSSSASSGDENETNTKKRVSRSYDVTEYVNDDDDTSGSSQFCDSDVDRCISATSSTREDQSSFASDDSDDDTGTGNVKRRSKAKNFFKVFIVNKNKSSSDTDAQSSNTNSIDDSSDNDTDTELNCGIVLNYVKTLNVNDDDDNDNNDVQCCADRTIDNNQLMHDDHNDNVAQRRIEIGNNKNIAQSTASTSLHELNNEYKEIKTTTTTAAAAAAINNLSEISDLHDHPSNVEELIAHDDEVNVRPALKNVDVENRTKNSDFSMHEHSIESIYDDNCRPIEETDNLSADKLETKSEINCDELDDHLATNKGIVVVAAAITDNDVNEQYVETVGRNTVIEAYNNDEFSDELNEVKHENLECVVQTNTADKIIKLSSIHVVDDDDDHHHHNHSINLLNDQAKVASTVGYDKTSSVPNDEDGTTNLLQSITTESALSLLIKNQNTADDNDRINISQQQHEHFSDECTFKSIQLNDHNNDIVCATGNPTTSGVEAAKTEEHSCGYTCESNYSMNNTNTHTSEVTVHSVENERSNSVDDGVAAKFTSLIMITQDLNRSPLEHQVSVVATDMIRIVSNDNSVTVKHTNNSHYDAEDNNFPNKNYTRSFKDDDNTSPSSSSSSAASKQPIRLNSSVNNNTLNNDDKTIVNNEKCDGRMKILSESVLVDDDVTVVASNVDTLSAVVCLEDGLADDDSWVEEISHDEEEFATTTATESDVEESEDFALCTVVDREEELRGFNRSAIDFTLHTIVEESCEESEVEQNNKTKNRMSASELEKYFFYGLGEGKPINSSELKDESLSDSSSICSDGMDSNAGSDDMSALDAMNSSSDLASSRLEKYFLTTFMGFAAEQRDTDGSGSVGSDSEGCPSPGQRRKRLVRARGTPRSHNSSLDNLLATNSDCHETSNASVDNHTDFMDYSESDTCDETVIHIEKSDNSNDTLKRKKQNKKRPDLSDENKLSSAPDLSVTSKETESEHSKTLQNEFATASYSLAQSRNQHSRDSGFIGSNDDLLKSEDLPNKSNDQKFELEEILEEQKESIENESSVQVQQSPEQQKIITTPSTKTTTATTTTTTTTALYRKDSFNNWSSDEETNLMMSKMRQFFKTLIAASANAQNMANNSKSSASVKSACGTPKDGTPVPKPRNKHKPPQLVYFENELTRLMKTVPGINDNQVREIVEYLSSEDTWSDSYDSSDYTSSDLEGNSVGNRKSELQEQISASCQQIIEKFDNIGDEEGDRGDGGLFEEGQIANWETAHVYQKLVASFSKMTTTNEKQLETTSSSNSTSPPIFTKVMSHIGTRLVALMHEVSSGESHASTSPKANVRYHRKLQQKISATTTEDDDSTSESNIERHDDLGFTNLPRSKSHDLLLSGTRPTHHQSSSGVDTTAEEKEASDYERFSWRGSFESALLANGDSRTKLTLLDKDNSSSASALAAKRRSAGDLLFNQNSLSREQLDRVRSCGSIGYDNDIETAKLWTSSSNQKSSRRRSSVPDATCDSDENTSDEDDRFALRSTLPRSLQNATSASTNSLPRLSTTNSQLSASMQKSHSVNHFLPNSVKSARYRPPGFNRPSAVPKKAVSSPGLQQSLYLKRDTRRRAHSFYGEESNASEMAGSSPIIGERHGSSGSASPVATKVASQDPWPTQTDEDIDRLVALHKNRSSLSSLGLRSDSMASVYSGAGEGRYGTVAVKGQIEFGMQYNYKQGALEIHIVQCKDLAAVDTKRNRSDPYVKLYLLPDKSKTGKRKTKVKKHTLNPVFDETLKFYMLLNSLESRTLWLTVWHSDMFGRNDFLGEVMITLQGKVFDNPQPQWYTLQERSEPFDDVVTYKGDIIVGLKFVPPDSSSSSQHSSPHSSGGLSLRKFGSIKSSPSSRSSSSKGSLHVLVKEGKNLNAVKANGFCDAFCKSYLLPDKNRSSKQKTPVMKRTVNPVWNYTFVYEDVSLQELSERALELTIWDHDRLSTNEFLGGIRFSLGTGKNNGRNVDWMDSTGKELSLWQNMLNRPNFWVEGSVILRSSLEKLN